MLISWAAAPTRASNTLANTAAILHDDDGDDGDDGDGDNDDGGGDEEDTKSSSLAECMS